MSADERKALFKKLDAKPTNLPKILSSDPQAVKLGAKPGDIIEIERDSDGKPYMYYRFVIQG